MKGFSLIETVFYIAILGIVLPSAVVFSVNLAQQFQVVDPRVRMEEKADVIENWVTREVGTAVSIDITNSTLGANPSTLVFIDNDTQTITLSRVQVTEEFPGDDQDVFRLKINDGIEDYFLTDADIDVTIWQVDEVRDSSSDLTGLNIVLETKMINPEEGAYRGSEFSSQTTIHLKPHTTEL
jgi:hypothetical protein